MKVVKKIVALASGAMMVGATLLGASASYTLADFPAPFIEDGIANTKIVIPSSPKASASDAAGAAKIALGLQAAATSELSRASHLRSFSVLLARVDTHARNREEERPRPRCRAAQRFVLEVAMDCRPQSNCVNGRGGWTYVARILHGSGIVVMRLWGRMHGRGSVRVGGHGDTNHSLYGH